MKVKIILATDAAIEGEVQKFFDATDIGEIISFSESYNATTKKHTVCIVYMIKEMDTKDFG